MKLRPFYKYLQVILSTIANVLNITDIIKNVNNRRRLNGYDPNSRKTTVITNQLEGNAHQGSGYCGQT